MLKLGDDRAGVDGLRAADAVFLGELALVRRRVHDHRLHAVARQLGCRAHEEIGAAEFELALLAPQADASAAARIQKRDGLGLGFCHVHDEE